jgi:chromosomal replication initiation ATPase DnaA
MYAPQKPAPKPDPLAVKLEIVADPDKAALEGKVQDLETMLGILREELIAVKKRRCMSIEALGTEAVLKLEDIIKTVAKYYGVSVGESPKQARAHIRSWPAFGKSGCICARSTHAGQSFPEIGRHFRS